MCVCGRVEHVCTHALTYVCVRVWGERQEEQMPNRRRAPPTPPCHVPHHGAPGLLDEPGAVLPARRQVSLLPRSTFRSRPEKRFLTLPDGSHSGSCSYWSCLPGPGLTGDRPYCPGRLISGTGLRRAAGRRRNYVCTTSSAEVLGLTVRQSLSQESPSGA